MIIKENIEQMLGAIAKNDVATATDLFQAVISQKVSDRLEDHKVQVADQYFNGFKEGSYEEEI